MSGFISAKETEEFLKNLSQEELITFLRIQNGALRAELKAERSLADRIMNITNNDHENNHTVTIRKLALETQKNRKVVL